MRNRSVCFLRASWYQGQYHSIKGEELATDEWRMAPDNNLDYSVCKIFYVIRRMKEMKKDICHRVPDDLENTFVEVYYKYKVYGDFLFIYSNFNSGSATPETWEKIIKLLPN